MAVETPVDTIASLASYHRGGEYVNVNGHVMLKHPTDLERYDKIIKETYPEVLIETGTRTGASAIWFSQHEELSLVLTIDVSGEHRIPTLRKLTNSKVIPIVGDSVSEDAASAIRRMVEGRRVMVSLDSDHTAEHVAREIELYGPLVSPGCFLVVEDGLFDYADAYEWQKFSFGNPAHGNPMDAIAQHLIPSDDWIRRLDIEGLHPISHHPAGWWQKKEAYNG